MERFTTTPVTEAAIRAVLERLGLTYRLILDSAGLFGLYAVIPAKDSAKKWIQRFWEAYDALEPAVKEQGVARPFDPDGVRFIKPSVVHDDLYLDQLFNEMDGPVAHLPAPHLQQWIQPSQVTTARSGHARRVVFYSYKGGVGRTTTMILSALVLAGRGKNVVLVDFDLEAPGLTASILPSQDIVEKGVVDYLLQWPAMVAQPRQRQSQMATDYLTLADLGVTGGGSINVLGAGRVDVDYPEKLAYVSLAEMERRWPENNPVDALFQDVEAALPRVDYIFVDSRTGVADIGGQLIFKYADAVCACFYSNVQNQEGMDLLVHHLARVQRRPAMVWVDTLSRLREQEFDPHEQLQAHLASAMARHGMGLPVPEILPIDFHEGLKRVSWDLLHNARPQEQDPHMLDDYVRLADQIESIWQAGGQEHRRA